MSATIKHENVVPQQAGLAKLKMPGAETEIELPVLLDVFGNQFIDIQSLQPKHGLCTYDPGFGSTVGD